VRYYTAAATNYALIDLWRCVDVRFKNQGLDSIEVQDNGSGISPANYSSVALKHYTSKLSSYSDIASLQTFGFRGEALASLCALSILTVTTCLEQDVPKGSKLAFQQSGKLESTNVVAAQRGTTVSVENLFHNLPVRRRELDRNIKREWHKVIALLNQYACIQTNVKFSVSQQPTKGKRILLFSTKGNPSTRDNIINIFGAKTLAALIPLELRLEIKPSGNRSDVRTGEKLASDCHDVRIVGHVSKPAHGEGRQTPDRQMFFVNGRPCLLPQLAKTFNEVYRSYNNSQSPFIFADVQLDTMLYDVNVSPDKRSILLHDQNNLLDTLRISLSQLFDSHEDKISISTSAKNVKLLSSQSKVTKTERPLQVFNKLVSETYTPAVLDNPSYESSESNPTEDSEESELDDKTTPASDMRSIKTRSRSNRMEKQRLDDNLESVTGGDVIRSPKNINPESPSRRATSMDRSPPHEGSSAASSIQVTPSRPQSSHDPSSTIHIQDFDSSSITAPDIPVVNVVSHGLRDRVTPSREMNSFSNATDVEGKSLPGERLRSRPPILDQTKELSAHSGPLQQDLEASSQPSSYILENAKSMHSVSTQHSQRDIQSIGEEPEFQRIKHKAIPVDNGSQVNTANLGGLPLEPKAQSSKPARRKDATTHFVQNLRVERGKLRLMRSAHLPRRTSLSTYPAHNTSSVERIDASDAESKLSLIIAKGDFSKMKVIGQFNLGFVITVKPAGRTSLNSEGKHDELFIIDQHASDEKYNYEKLQNTTEIQSQRLVHPMRLRLTALEEEIILENPTALNANGFKVITDTTGNFPVGSRCQLVALPLSREVTFKLEDLEELISLLGDKSAESSYIPRPSKVQKMLAMRACRSSIMIGKAMTRSQMYSLVNHMGELDKPWNCPHGRPTIRHLSRLQTWSAVGWKHDRHTDSIATWQDYIGEEVNY
jgi:DNA mismatch repair protein PMS2